MNKSTYLWISAGVLILLFIIIFQEKESSRSNPVNQEPLSAKTPLQDSQTKAPTPSTTDLSKYNIPYVDNDRIKSIIDENIKGKRIYFYLPPEGYLNVSKGTAFGIAFGMNNLNPKKEDYFTYTVTPESSMLSSCKVSEKEALSWITLGQNSFGRIPEGWIDKTAVVFSFPINAPSCKASYHFELIKNSEVYATQTIEINIRP